MFSPNVLPLLLSHVVVLRRWVFALASGCCLSLGVQRAYLAVDSLKEAKDAGHDLSAEACSVLDYVARRTLAGLPPHTLTVKTNSVYCLLRNFHIDCGLIKNGRVRRRYLPRHCLHFATRNRYRI